MARVDTLQNFLTDIADKLREKLGTTGIIEHADYDTKIDEAYEAGYTKGQSEGGGSSETDLLNITDWSWLFYDNARSSLMSSLKYTDTSHVTNFYYTYGKCTFTTAPEIDTSKGYKFNYIYYDCKYLTKVPRFNLSACGYSCTHPFRNCTALVEIGFEGTIRNSQAWSSFLVDSPNVNQESLHKMIDCLSDNCYGYTIGIGSTNLAKISDEYLAKVTAKNAKLQ